MSNIMNRVNLMLEVNMIDKDDYRDIEDVIKITKKLSGVELTEENGGVLITHIAAMFRRNKTDEILNDLDEFIKQQILDGQFYKIANEIVTSIKGEINNEVNEVEMWFLKLHFSNIIKNHKEKR